MSRVSLVLEDREPVGWVCVDMMIQDEDDSVGDCAEQIQPCALLSADTSALEALQRFAVSKARFFFVLDRTQITGVLHYEDLFRLPFRLCMFALVLHLEDSALRVVKQDPKESWQVLPPDRRRKAEEIYEKRHGQPPDAKSPPSAELLECTMFCDKGTIIRKRGLLTDVTAKAIKTVFSRAEKIRNDCAHPGPDDAFTAAVIRRSELLRFTNDARSLIEKIEALL